MSCRPPPLKFRDVDAERANGLCAPGAGACLTYVTPTNLSTLPQIESTWKIPCIVALTRHSTVSGIFSGLWKAYNSTSIYRSRLPLTISISRHQWLLLHFNIALHRDLYKFQDGRQREHPPLGAHLDPSEDQYGRDDCGDAVLTTEAHGVYSLFRKLHLHCCGYLVVWSGYLSSPHQCIYGIWRNSTANGAFNAVFGRVGTSTSVID